MKISKYHCDEGIGFVAESPTIYADKYVNKAEIVYMLIVCGNHSLSISVENDDFTLLGWSLAFILNDRFDEYDSYFLSSKDWLRVLNQSEKILNFDDFDELFDYFRAWKTNNVYVDYMIYNLNHSGEYFWHHKNKYKKQIADLKKWSELVLKDCDEIKIIGF